MYFCQKRDRTDGWWKHEADVTSYWCKCKGNTNDNKSLYKTLFGLLMGNYFCLKYTAIFNSFILSCLYLVGLT